MSRRKERQVSCSHLGGQGASMCATPKRRKGTKSVHEGRSGTALVMNHETWGRICSVAGSCTAPVKPALKSSFISLPKYSQDTGAEDIPLPKSSQSGPAQPCGP